MVLLILPLRGSVTFTVSFTGKLERKIGRWSRAPAAEKIAPPAALARPNNLTQTEF